MNVKGTKSFYKWQSAQADTQNMSLAEKATPKNPQKKESS